MSGIQVNMYVEVKDRSDWEKLYDMDIPEGMFIDTIKKGKDLLGDLTGTVWEIDDEWSPDYFAFTSFFSQIGRLLGKDRHYRYAAMWFISSDTYSVWYDFGGWGDQKNVRDFVDIWNLEVFLKDSKISLRPADIKNLCSFQNENLAFLKDRTAQRIEAYGDKQNRGRIFVAVKDATQWKNLNKDDFSDPKFALPQDKIDRLCNMDSTTYVIDDEWHIEYGEDKKSALYELISILIEKLGHDECVILADCADPDKALLYTVYSYFGGKKADCSEATNDMGKVEISDPISWMKQAQVKLSAKRKAYLSAFPSNDMFIKKK